MLDGLLNRGFSSKCKSEIKDVKRRLEVVRRRAEAKQKFLKEDLVKLLADGHDINAYGRTEEFLAGLNLLSCYDFIEYTCEYIVKHLTSMQKQRECPEECREAVASLMFAAARFSELPELRDLRDLLQERYGVDLGCFVNQKFLEKLSSLPPTAEKRLHLLQDIATEYSIQWDGRGFEQRMAASLTLAQVQSSKCGLFMAVNDKCLLDADRNEAKSYKYDALPEPSHTGHDKAPGRHSSREGNNSRKEESNLRCHGRSKRTAQEQLKLSANEEAARRFDTGFVVPRRQEAIENKSESSIKDDNLPNALKSGSSSCRKWPDSAGRRYKVQSDGLCDFNGGESWEVSSLWKKENSHSYNGLTAKNEDTSSAKEDIEKQKPANSDRPMQKEDPESLTAANSTLPPPYVKSIHNAIPPPYVKPKEGKHKVASMTKLDVSDSDGHSSNPSPAVGGANRKHNSLDNVVFEEQEAAEDRVRGHKNEQFYDDNKIPLPRPRSVRRKQYTSSSTHDYLSHIEGDALVRRSSSSRRKENSRKGVQIQFDDENHRKDEEERIMDKLLLHYSKKPSTCESGKVRRKPESNSVQQPATSTGESSHDQSRDGLSGKSEALSPSMRSISMPHEHTVNTEAKKTFERAYSFQPDNRARHVHPKLPKYDDLAAQFAALRVREG